MISKYRGSADPSNCHFKDFILHFLRLNNYEPPSQVTKKSYTTSGIGAITPSLEKEQDSPN